MGSNTIADGRDLALTGKRAAPSYGKFAKKRSFGSAFTSSSNDGRPVSTANRGSAISSSSSSTRSTGTATAGQPGGADKRDRLALDDLYTFEDDDPPRREQKPKPTKPISNGPAKRQHTLLAAPKIIPASEIREVSAGAKTTKPGLAQVVAKPKETSVRDRPSNIAQRPKIPPKEPLKRDYSSLKRSPAAKPATASPSPKRVTFSPGTKSSTGTKAATAPSTPHATSPRPSSIGLGKRPELSTTPLSSSRPASSSRTSPAPVTSNRASASPAKRSRLIDALADQADDDSDLSDQDTPITYDSRHLAFLSTPTQPVADQSPRPGSAVRTSAVKGPVAGQGPRVTYGAQRSMLRQTSSGLSTDDSDPWGIPSIPDLSVPLTSNMDFSVPDDESDDESGAKGAMRSIHELRQAGANNRFADEMDDLFDRIRTPSKPPTSMRRNALLEFATKMQKKTFLRQLRDHGAQDRLLDKIGEEEDIMSGFALVSALLTLLASGPAPHVTQQLHAGNVSAFLVKLLEKDDDVCELAGQRSSNLSRNGRASVAELKGSVLKLPVWNGKAPQALSPRTLTLRFLDLVCKPGGGDAMATFNGITEILFRILGDCLDPDYWDEPMASEHHDCLVAATLLESCSVQAMQSQAAETWTSKYLSVVSRVVTTVLQRKDASPSEFVNAVLKLALNMTNNNAAADEVFGDFVAFGELASGVGDGFGLVKVRVEGGDMEEDAYHRLILMTGVMINLCENCPSLRRSSLPEAVLDRIIEIYLDNHNITTEADSLKKSHLNVAVGYIAILLGYLVLSAPARQQFVKRNSGRGLGSLVASIQEFVTLNRRVDRQDGSDHAGGLQRLADELRMVDRRS